MSSSCCVVSLPGDGLVVGGVGFQAAGQDADESVGDLSQCCLVADPAFARRLGRDELVEHEWQESAAGPPRKYLRLTDAVEDQLAQFRSYWTELTAMLETIGH